MNASASHFHGVELEALLAAGVHPRFYPVHLGMQVNAEEVCCRITSETAAGPRLLLVRGWRWEFFDFCYRCRSFGRW